MKKSLIALSLICGSLVATQTKIDVDLVFVTEVRSENSKNAVEAQAVVMLNDENKGELKIGDLTLRFETLERDEQCVTIKSIVEQDNQVVCQSVIKTQWGMKATIDLENKDLEQSASELCITITPSIVNEEAKTN